MGFHFLEYFLKLGIERSLILQENFKSKIDYSFKKQKLGNTNNYIILRWTIVLYATM
jgi:hypothetical protein